MNDDRQQSSEKSAAGPVAGERLAEARRLKQISLPDVARQLHLDEPRVQALEENRFDVLGAPVFAKGYLRKYAKLVGVSVDDVMADYYTLNRATGAPPVVGPPRNVPREFDATPWIVGLLAIIGLAIAGYWWLQRGPADFPAAPAETTVPVTEAGDAPELSAARGEPDVTTANGGPDAPAAEPLPQPAAAGADAGTDAAAPTVPVRQPAAAPSSDRSPPVAAGGLVELRLAFSGDCWTEVGDADGRRLFFDLGTAGRNVNVRGRAPLDVLVGNEENVRLAVNGEPYTIGAASRRGNTARFTIRQ